MNESTRSRQEGGEKTGQKQRHGAERLSTSRTEPGAMKIGPKTGQKERTV